MGGLKRPADDGAVMDTMEGLELSTAGTGMTDGGLTAWLALCTSDSIRMTCTDVLLDTTVDCVATTAGDAGRHVDTLST